MSKIVAIYRMMKRPKGQGCDRGESRVTELTKFNPEKKIQNSSNGHFGLKGDRA